MTTEFNIPYGKLTEQKLDYYKTENAESSPLFVYFHGGGLECGDRGNGTPIAFEYNSVLIDVPLGVKSKILGRHCGLCVLDI